MVTRDVITEELLKGTTPAQLARKYPRKSVYRIYNELVQSGQLPEPGTIVIEGEEPPKTPLFIPAAPATSTAVEEEKRMAGAETVELGPKSLPVDAVNRIRGILGITLRPKVLSCPMPELLYPAMVIAVTELGFKPMRPDDFIDTVLYQWLEACDYVPYAYMKKSELEEFAKTYGVNIEEFAREHGLMTEDDFAEKYGIILPEQGEEEDESEIGKVIGEVEIIEDKPHKPTVGDLLNRLHISNIQKEVEKNGSAGRTESIGSQGRDESEE